MNSFSKCLAAAVLVALLASTASAIQINALYISACKREVGVITGVGSKDVQLLKLDGTLINVPRYEIIYLAYYPIDVLPMTHVKANKELKFVNVKTLHDNKIVDMMSGWPIDFSDTKISFLTPAGGEAVINRDSLWGLDISDSSEDVQFKNVIKERYEFIHPYSFEYCPTEIVGRKEGSEKARKVFPQQILSDPIMIKKELDRLNKGHEGIVEYNREQKFYAIPQEYTNNLTSLGLWLSMGGRYGVSSSRTNYTPLLTDEYSSGPFGFQRTFVTGSAPILETIHEEPQTEAYYRFKADYFHLTAMVDPNLILAGTKYNWQLQDLPNNNDDRSSEAGFLELGFDWGHFALNLYAAGAANTGIRANGDFFQQSENVSRFGLTYLSHIFKVSAVYGQSGAQPINFTFGRANGQVKLFKDFDVVYSFIYRKMTYSPNPGDAHYFQYASTSVTNALYLYYMLSYKVILGAFGSLEMWSNQFGPTSLSQSSSQLYPKLGVYGALTF